MRALRTRLRAALSLVTIGLVFVPTVAFGQAAGSKKSARKQALELFDQSAESYRAGRFDEAAKLLEKAYALHQEPVLLYNLGRAYEGLGEYEKAVDAYRRYLEQAPDAKDRGALERRVETMEQQIAEKEKLEANQKRPEDAASQQKQKKEPKQDKPAKADSGESWFPGPIPWIVAGVGVAGLAAGGYFGVRASSKRSEAADEPVQRRAADTFSEAESAASMANVFFIAGAVLTAGGVTWIVLDQSGKSNKEKKARIELHLSPTGVAVGGRL